MTLDEAIKHCKEVAEQKDLESGFDTDNERYIMTDNERADCKECANEHKQLAEWLTDYKRLKEQEPKRKVGEWIKKNNDYFDWYECSECGYGSDGEMKYNRLCDVRTKFCPDCGSQNLKGE